VKAGCWAGVRLAASAVAASALLLLVASSASAQFCSGSEAPCIETQGPIVPAQPISFRLPAGAYRGDAYILQGQPDGRVVRSPLVREEGPISHQDGYDRHVALFPAIVFEPCPDICTGPILDGRTSIHVEYRLDPGSPRLEFQAETDVIAPTANRSATIVKDQGTFAGKLSFEARREVRVRMLLELRGKRTGPQKKWKDLAKVAADDIVVGAGSHAIPGPTLSRRCPERFSKCSVGFAAFIDTEAFGRWHPAASESSRIRFGQDD
jgi:hypothetical protein